MKNDSPKYMIQPLCIVYISLIDKCLISRPKDIPALKSVFKPKVLPALKNVFSPKCYLHRKAFICHKCYLR